MSASSRSVLQVEGPGENGIKRIAVSPSDSAEAIERCLQNLFGAPPEFAPVLYDASGCALPLGPALLSSGSANGSVFKLEFVARGNSQPAQQRPQAAREAEVETPASSAVTTVSSAGNGPLPAQPFGNGVFQGDECEFWSNLSEGFRCHNGSIRNSSVSCFSIGTKDIWQAEEFDTSPHYIDNLYDKWTGGSGAELTHRALMDKLKDGYGINIDNAQLSAALQRVRHNLRGDPASRGAVGSTVSRLEFSSLWQRLMLGAVRRHAANSQEKGYDGKRQNILVHEYNKHVFCKDWYSEEDFFFRRLQGSSAKVKGHGEAVSRWVRIDDAGPDRLVRLGVKFFLHPLATTDAMRAAMEGTTNMVRFRHQYIVSLEVYSSTMPWKLPEGAAPVEVGKHVVRSSMFLVATGNPAAGYRDWLLSIVNAERQRQSMADPLDFFSSDTAAASKVLDAVKGDLYSHHHAREYMADFLLYSIIDGAVCELMPICSAYAYRLRWLQAQLDSLKLRLPAGLLREVLRMKLELQELQQWRGQVKMIVNHLHDDCKGCHEIEGHALWNFGRWSGGNGRSLLMFFESTKHRLDQAYDRISVLQQLAGSFVEDHQRHQDSFMNQTLLALTIATAIFMPSQFVAGVYGTNFERDDGRPAPDELRWKHGYLYFWLLTGGLIIAGALLICCCLRKYRRI
mmetsp:Transcript_57865/g.96404  ORF Transcript_57865/g.96404 Transcript_57865/m.96404 type:complete len:680 (-) Transcript_57865:55-2094(-)